MVGLRDSIQDVFGDLSIGLTERSRRYGFLLRSGILALAISEELDDRLRKLIKSAFSMNPPEVEITDLAEVQKQID